MCLIDTIVKNSFKAKKEKNKRTTTTKKDGSSVSVAQVLEEVTIYKCYLLIWFKENITIGPE